MALVLAITTWFYIVVELHKGTIEERKMLQRILPYKMVSRQFPIKLNLTGKPEEGYVVAYDKIVIDPSMCVMIGPKSLLDKLETMKTEPIDITEYKRTVTKDVSIVPPVKGVILKEKFINVTIPIVKFND